MFTVTKRKTTVSFLLQVTAWATHRGCAFHWGQAVWRKIADVGLQSAYAADEGTHRLCRRLLALPYLPAEHIGDEFHRLQQNATTDKLQQLMTYVADNWIMSATWPPETWCVYGQHVRTNNDVEGWHHRLNRKAQQSGLNMYLLCALLGHEASMVTLNVKLMSDNKVRRTRRKNSVSTDARLQRYWAEYQAGSRSVSRLLNACARMFAPRLQVSKVVSKCDL